MARTMNTQDCGRRFRTEEPASQSGRPPLPESIGPLREKGEELLGGAGAMVERAKERVQEMTSTAYEAAGERAQEAAELARKTANDLGSLVRRYPIPTALACIGLGFLVAKWTRS